MTAPYCFGRSSNLTAFEGFATVGLDPPNKLSKNPGS
jgi:hypothetical protein